MRFKAEIVAAAILFLLLPAALPAEEGGSSSAGGAKEKEREEGKVWTNEDLEKLGPGGVSTLGDVRILSSASPATARRGEIWWRTEFRLLREQARKLEAEIAETERRRGLASNPFTRAMVKDSEGGIASPAELNARLESLRKSLAATRGSLAQLEEKAREENVPSSWVRPPPQREERKKGDEAEEDRPGQIVRP